MGAVTIDEEDKRALDIIFSKIRAKTLPIYLYTTSAAIRPVRPCPTLQLSGTLFVITEGILLYGYISMGGYIITEAEKANKGVVDAFARPLLTSYTLLFRLYAKTFPGFGKNWKPDLSPLKIILGPEELPKMFFF
jgi:hypothetical protein